MNLPRWFLHPILIFILSIAALGVSLFLYIHWYVEASTMLQSAMEKFDLDQGRVLQSRTWVVIMVLSILVGVILMGIFSIFIYSQKTVQLYRLQNNFINNFTHELKTPVTSLKMFLETFSRHDLSKEDQDKYLGYMIADVNRLKENIDRILNLASIESKSYAEEFTSVDLVSVIETFFRNNQHLFTNARVQIHKPSEPLPPYQINLSLFEMLLMNLATNAVKYNDKDCPQLDIRFSEDRSRRFIHFADNGIGFEKNEIRKIFRKFYQVGRFDDMTAKGTGLGLYLVQTVAKLHRWKVAAQSEGIGKGSVFTLTLPKDARQ
ncbi:MAG: HAMP domain-containing histidine kinase [Desulfobacterales bacterium]|nr:HAMP domain-containing histidine kinase [Desulfobacterales bacterium]